MCFLVLRGISDFGDDRKKELDAIGAGDLRRYAMGNAVRFLWGLLDAEERPRADDSSRSAGRPRRVLLERLWLPGLHSFRSLIHGAPLRSPRMNPRADFQRRRPTFGQEFRRAVYSVVGLDPPGEALTKGACHGSDNITTPHWESGRDWGRWRRYPVYHTVVISG